MFEEQKEAQVVHISSFISKFYLFADLTEYTVIGRFFQNISGVDSIVCSVSDLHTQPFTSSAMTLIDKTASICNTCLLSQIDYWCSIILYRYMF